MRHPWLISLLAFSLTAQAGQTLRIGQQVLTVGDTAAHAVALLGVPALKEPVENTFGAYLGERWQYTRENGHVVVVTIIGGKVADIDDRQH
ncbi:DUF2845 domain-containing protein [Rhodanobacter denitrificans]|uniref:DUF2845 domain-containing protein n=1 Tax=Rhodanobacter denitrificans TaxID=666685 RepID=M4NLK5_9GAMM|nr:DUF2845 domain-containing protein [Rhodanobacter denitrificans]AGG90528.1 hypothetical protein R2APBS1_3465 [Rhodanobacter denitrificans]UJM85911.1 DUF2845 domain-containing protein [Rhodanobacter denitrificans]